MISTTTLSVNEVRKFLQHLRACRQSCRLTGFGTPAGLELRGRAGARLRPSSLLEVGAELFNLAILAAGDFSNLREELCELRFGGIVGDLREVGLGIR